jgi:hypothetical protein
VELEGSGSQVSGKMQNWYEVLGIAMGATDTVVDEAIERMSRQASALANTAPDRSQQMRDTLRAIKRDLRSDAEARFRYDEKLSEAKQVADSRERPAHSAHESTVGFEDSNAPEIPSIVDAVISNIAPMATRFRRFLQSGWKCPSCGADGGPGDRFCMKCGAGMKSETINPVQIRQCAKCTTTLAETDRFCGSCGTPTT